MSSANSLYRVAEIRDIERAAMTHLPPGELMQRAGRAAAQYALELIGDERHNREILVLAGPGNNGGDALVAASLLAHAGLHVTLLLFMDSAHQPNDAQQALQRATQSPVDIVTHFSIDAITSTDWSLVIDGLFGIGLTRPVSGLIREAIGAINEQRCPILALDIPSGLDADTGNTVGDDGVAVKATHTLTFIGNKPGLHTSSGRDYAGIVQVADLDINSRHFQPASAYLNDTERFSGYLHPRAHNSHKGSYGDVMIIGGGQGMAGAPILAARSALKCGAGRVFVGFAEDPPRYDSLSPELMCRDAHELDFSAATLVVGPGLGNSHVARTLVEKAVCANGSLVLDADALNMIAASSDLQKKLMHRITPTIITPHPLEAARLLQQQTARHIQADRQAAARQLAKQFNAIAILKGSGTVIAKSDGKLIINTTGNAALATAGTGDVLAGVCGALMAQAVPAWEAALAATWLHGRAADTLVREGVGPIGMSASELIGGIRTALNQLIEQHRSR